MTLGEYCKLFAWCRMNYSQILMISFISFSFYVSGLPTGREWSKSKRYSTHVTPVNGMVGTDTYRPWLHDQANNIQGKCHVYQYIHPPPLLPSPMSPSVKCDFLFFGGGVGAFLMTAACRAYLAWYIENFSTTPTPFPCFFQLVTSLAQATLI